MRKMSEDFIGTCQWCFGEYKVNARREVVLHGYQRPGIGYTLGNCRGYNHAPFEDAHDLTEVRIEELRANVTKLRNHIKKINAGQITQIRNPRYVAQDDPRRAKGYYFGKDTEIEIYTPDHESFNHYLQIMKANLESEIKFDEDIIAFLSGQVRNWTKRSIIGLDSPATGKERYVRDAFDPVKVKEAEEHAQRKAERDAKPGKITLTIYKVMPDYVALTGDQEKDWEARTAQIDAGYAEQKRFRKAAKEWAMATFPAAKAPWTGDVYEGDITRRSIRPDLRGKNLVAVAIKIDWQYLDEVLNMFPAGNFVHYYDNSPKDRRIFVDYEELPAEL